MKTVILFGFKGVGKTTLGKKLAAACQTLFLDTDDLIASDCRAFFKEQGEEKFRAKEADVIQTISPFQGVIALGGGALLNPKNEAHLRKIGQLIYLQASKESIKERVLTSGFLKDPSEFEAFYEKRVQHYEKIEAIKVSIENKNENEIIRGLKEVMNLSVNY